MVKQYNRTVSLAFDLPLLEMAKSVREVQLNLAKSLQFALNPFAVRLEPAIDIQEAEIVEDSCGIFDLILSIEGRFYFKGQLVDSISTNSKHGRMLRLLLINDENYVSDKEIHKVIGIMDKDKGIGYLRRDLKKALFQFGLEINMYRETQKGYRLLAISELPN